jgi:hypothetical protein
LSLHGPGRTAQRLSGDRCGPHTAFLDSSSSFILGFFLHCVTESSEAIFFACFRLALILFQLSLTLCETNCLLISSLYASGLRLRGSAALLFSQCKRWNFNVLPVAFSGFTSFFYISKVFAVFIDTLHPLQCSTVRYLRNMIP